MKAITMLSEISLYVTPFMIRLLNNHQVTQKRITQQIKGLVSLPTCSAGCEIFCRSHDNQHSREAEIRLIFQSQCYDKIKAIPH